MTSVSSSSRPALSISTTLLSSPPPQQQQQQDSALAMPSNNILSHSSTSAASSAVSIARLSASAAGEARYFAHAVASWYLNTLDPYSPHVHNIEGRLRHPVHVVTRRILYGNVHATTVAVDEDSERNGSINNNNNNNNNGGAGSDGDNLEALFNDDDAEIKEGPETLSRRSAARMEAFLASCAVALRDEEHGHHPPDPTNKGVGANVSISGKIDGEGSSGGIRRVGNGMKVDKKSMPLDGGTSGVARARSNSSCKPKRCRQIDMGDLLLRLEIYCRTLRRIRSISDANPSTATSGNLILQECVIQWEPKKAIRSRIGLIVQTFLRNVDCVRDVHTTLMTLVLRATLEVLAVEVWCPELRSTVQRLASEYEHKVSFASLAFLSSPDNSVETHLVPLLSKYFEYLQLNWEMLVSKCELERMLRSVLDQDLRQYFKNSVFRSVGHILDECRRERESLDNISLPPPWKEGVLGLVNGGGDATARRGGGGDNVDSAIKQYISDPALVKQALRDLRREVITVNGIPLPPANSQMEFAEYLGKVLNSKQLELSISSPKSVNMKMKKSSRRRVTNYSSDVGLELEEESDFSGMDSDGSISTKIDVGLVESLARRLLIAASRTGSGGDAYFIVRDLFGGDEVEVVPHHSSSGRMNQGTIEIIVKLSNVILKSHAKFDIFPKPVVSNSDALIQFHTTTTENISLQQCRGTSCITLKEKKTNLTGWRTLAIRPAYYERLPQMH